MASINLGSLNLQCCLQFAILYAPTGKSLSVFLQSKLIRQEENILLTGKKLSLYIHSLQGDGYKHRCSFWPQRRILFGSRALWNTSSARFSSLFEESVENHWFRLLQQSRNLLKLVGLLQVLSSLLSIPQRVLFLLTAVFI